MVQTIEKLQREKEKLTTRFKQNKTEYKSEIKRINTAIKRFSQGYEALRMTALESSPKRGMANEIENILKVGAMHLKQIVNELESRGFSSVKYQSVSAVLQTYAKAGNKFFKVAPATYALIPTEAQLEQLRTEQKSDCDESLSSEFLSEDTYEF